MENAVLEINVNVNGQQENGIKENANREQRARGGNISADRSKLFKKRIRTASNGIDIVGKIKNSVETNIYNSVGEKTGNTKTASKAAGAAGLGIALIGQVAKKTISTATSMVGTFTSNEANQNAIDNTTMIMNDSMNAISTIGVGAAVGGWVGAIVAAVGVTANKALSIATSALETAKHNTEKIGETARIADRLGYIECGYSR